MTEYIDREDLAKHLDILYNRLCGKSPYFYCGFQTAVDYAKEFSAADVAPVVHGRWIDGKCSNCGVDIPTDDAHDAIFEDECRFCYYCGARMEGAE